MKSTTQLREAFSKEFPNPWDYLEQHTDYWIAIIESERRGLREKIEGMKVQPSFTESSYEDGIKDGINVGLNDVLSLLQDNEEIK